MAQADFQARLQRLERRTPQPAAPETPAPRSGGGGGGTRRDRLNRALQILDRNGVRGDWAYSKVFRMLARVGLGPKPLHFWSAPALFFGSFVFFTLLMGTVIGLAIAMDAVSGPIRGAVNAGPVAFFGMMLLMSTGFTVLHRVQARRMGLPRWRDL